MIHAAAVCPHPPALVPEVAAGAAHDLADVRAACDAAINAMLEHDPERVVVIGAGDLPHDLDESAGGTLAGFGIDVRAGGEDLRLPLSLTIGAWLLDRAGWSDARTYSTGTPDTVGRVVLLVMADGSARRSQTAPGYLDPRAEAYDAAVATALAMGDADVLAALDTELAAQLWAAGAPALRTLGQMTKGAGISARLRIDAAPFGVGYWVADWVLA